MADTVEREMIGEFDRISRIILLGAAKDLDAVGGFRLADRAKFVHVFAANSLRVLRMIEDRVVYTEQILRYISGIRRHLFDMARTDAPVMSRIYSRLAHEFVTLQSLSPLRTSVFDIVNMCKSVPPEQHKFLGHFPIDAQVSDADVVPCPWASAWSATTHK